MPAKYQRQIRARVKSYRVVKDDGSESHKFLKKSEVAAFLGSSEEVVNGMVYGRRSRKGWWVRPVY